MLAGGRVTVPSNCWKVIVVLPVGSNTRVIAENTPNLNSLSVDWGTYRTSVDAIDAAKGYDLLSAVPVSVQAAMENKTDMGPTN